MAMSNVSMEEQLLQFLKEHRGDLLKMEVLAFWGRHPNARFEKSAIADALDCKKLDIDRALKDMVEMGVLDMYMYNDTPFYSLTLNEERRRTVLELASIDGSPGRR